MTDILGADFGAILLLGEGDDQLVVGATHGLAAGPEKTLEVPLEGTLAGRIVSERRSAQLEEGEAAAVASLLDGEPVRSLLGAPLIVEGRVSGVIEVGMLRKRMFTMEDETVLALIAGRAALAIEHGRLYQRELGIVETLQRSLLPDRLPEVPGLLTAARYMPGGPGADVGGDWYDAIGLDGGRLGLAMGDVVGHGIGAAALMGQLRNALRAYALDGASPGEGHLPPLVLRPDGDALFVEGGRTLPLGVMPSIEYPEATFELDPGSTIIMYTDGLVEERGASIDAGLDT